MNVKTGELFGANGFFLGKQPDNSMTMPIIAKNPTYRAKTDAIQ
jgi:hypothetical protein